MQIVGYEPPAVGDTGTATLVVASEGTVRREPLVPGESIDYRLGERHCAGVLEDGRHERCTAGTAPRCDRHTSRWACARCTGDCDRPLPACDEEHAVYLAAFAPAQFKVGVTRSWRLETRLREQGADRAAHVRTVPDGRTAREIEAAIAAGTEGGTPGGAANGGVDVVDRVRVAAKARHLHRSVDETAWTTLLAAFDPIERYDFDYGFSLGERPMAETLASGTIRGAQGRVLLLDREGSTYAVDGRDLVGHEIAEGGADRDLQSSFSAFE